MSSLTRPRVLAQGLTYVVDGDRPPLFEDLSLSFSDERTGVVGPNGSGKTTLARLLAGELRPQRGSVVVEGAVAYLPQDHERLFGGTVADALGVGHELRALWRVLDGQGDERDLLVIGDRWSLEDQARAALERLGVAHIDLHRSAASLSGGERTRVAIAGCLLLEPCFLILDEPTNHLDRDAREGVYRLVEEHPGALYISHDRELLSRVDRVLELGPLGPRLYGGDLSLYEEQRRLEAEAAEHRLEHAKQEAERARRELQLARERKERRDGRGQRKRSEGGQAKVLLDRAKERSEQTKGRMSSLAHRREREVEATLAEARSHVAREETLSFDLAPTKVPAGKVVVAVEELAWAPAEGASLLEGISLRVVGPERVAVTGPNGSGKTTLLKLLAGRLEPTRGRVRVGVEEVAWLDQDLALAGGLTVLEALRRARPDLPEGACRERLAPFLFRRDDVNKRVGALSGGERLRLGLCLELSRERAPRLLLLDEPTNHLDLSSLERLEAVLRAYQGALVVVSHDESFLDRVGVERRLALREGRLAPPGGAEGVAPAPS